MPTNVPTELVTMRLVDMSMVHPAQDNSRVCSRCGQQVGIYPSGQGILRNNPNIKIVCAVCVVKDPNPIENIAGPPIEVLAQERRDSHKVGEA
jgi:hypothetical protein